MGEALRTVTGFAAVAQVPVIVRLDLAAQNPLTRLQSLERFQKKFPNSDFVFQPGSEPGTRTQRVAAMSVSKKRPGEHLGADSVPIPGKQTRI